MNVRGSFWRQLAYAGARYGPRPWVEHSPAFFGALFACLLPNERRRVRRNLRRLRGEERLFGESIDVVRTFVAYAHCLAESLAQERPEARASEPRVFGDEHLDTAIARGKGVVIVTAHTGAWDVAARFLGRDRALDVMLVMAAEADPTARRLHDDLRERLGVRVAHVGRHALDALPLLSHLKAGGVVAIQLDRVAASVPALEVSLGGQPFRVPAGPFQLASLTGASIVPVFARREGYFRYEVFVRPAVLVAPKANRATLETAAAEVAAEMERFLREYPTEWFHFSE